MEDVYAVEPVPSKRHTPCMQPGGGGGSERGAALGVGRGRCMGSARMRGCVSWMVAGSSIQGLALIGKNVDTLHLY